VYANDPSGCPFSYQEGEATQKARLDNAAGRLRLLYVGITRAEKALIVTWNSCRRGDLQSAVPFIALWTYWEAHTPDARPNLSTPICGDYLAR
jgi:superfamily I DNA/RNA helicase